MNDIFQTPTNIGLLGSTCLVGRLILNALNNENYKIYPYTRRSPQNLENATDWIQIDNFDLPNSEKLDILICAAPIWILREYLETISFSRLKRVIAFSSTSLFIKENSTNQIEQALSKKLFEAEKFLKDWAEFNKIEWVIFRPTMIYGLGKDKNISEIARFIKSFKFFPVIGSANGLRQPLHAQDLAKVCIIALKKHKLKNKAYNLSGGETLTYRDMVLRIFNALMFPVRVIHCPLICFYFGIQFIKLVPRYKDWTIEMVIRMNQDLIFDHTEAMTDFDFHPQSFFLKANDLPN